MDRDEYANRIEAKRERLEERADRAEAEAARHLGAERAILNVIPIGQPILVGHHSERRHRRDLARAESHLRAGIEAQKQAANLRARAGSLGEHGIASEDPDAIDKLEAKAATLEAERDRMKRRNALYRKGGWAAVAAAGLANAEDVARLEAATAAIAYSGDRKPHATWELTNIGARIRDARARAESLRRVEATVSAGVAPVHGVTRDGGISYTIEQDAHEARVLVTFAARPPREVCAAMREYGFKWAPSRGAWSRLLNQAGQNAAELVHARLSRKGGQS